MPEAEWQKWAKALEEGPREGEGGDRTFVGCAWGCCPQHRCRVVARNLGETVTGTGPFRRACDWVGSLALASPTIGSCQGQSGQRSIRASEKPPNHHPLEDRQLHCRVATSRRPSQSRSLMDPTLKCQSLPRRRLTARCSLSLRRALRSLRPY